MGLFRKRPDTSELDRLRDEIADLRQQLERHDSSRTDLAARVDSIEVGRDELTQRVTALDARVTSVSTELALQLDELGHDVDGLTDRPAANGDGAAVAELRDGQVRLAAEQARYQIAFREDLAVLAEQLRRVPA
jgi:chromosome segregation ATPase